MFHNRCAARQSLMCRRIMIIYTDILKQNMTVLKFAIIGQRSPNLLLHEARDVIFCGPLTIFYHFKSCPLGAAAALYYISKNSLQD